MKYFFLTCFDIFCYIYLFKAKTTKLSSTHLFMNLFSFSNSINNAETYKFEAQVGTTSDEDKVIFY